MMLEDVPEGVQSARERRYALVIGVDQAPAAQDLRLHQELHAVRDAQAIAQVLQEEYCGFQQVTLLSGEDVNSDDMRRAILSFGRDKTDDDFLLLYFAGHGYVMNSDTYLVSNDFNEQDEEDSPQMHISLPWLRDRFYFSTGAGKVLLVLDCCYAGNIERTPVELSVGELMDHLKARFNDYFGIPLTNTPGKYRPDMLRQALTATSYGQTAGEEKSHGIMTGYLLSALRGEVERVIDVDNEGAVSQYRVYEYILDEMRKHVPPLLQRPDLPGKPGGRLCILATHKERAEQIRQRNRRIIHTTPRTYIAGAPSDSFQQRPDEFEKVTELLLEKSPTAIHGPVVGLIGLGGVGKTQLAVELAYTYKKEQRFPAGIFWLPITGTDEASLLQRLAALCSNAEYLPSGDDVSQSENEKHRAQHLCKYLVQHSDALLILDNVDQNQIDTLLRTHFPAITGDALRCTILYTSRFDAAPTYVKKYAVEGLTEEGALHLLLEHRKALLDQVLAGDRGPEAQAARAICSYIERFPLALLMLRDLLQDDPLTLIHLWEEQQKQGTIAITRSGQSILEARLFRAFEQSWKKITSPDAQLLFKLAIHFPAALPIPLWLLGLAADLKGETVLESLGAARQALQRWSLITFLPDSRMLTIHPLVREFGCIIVQNDPQHTSWLEHASNRLLEEFATIDALRLRIMAKGYWVSLSDLQEALAYARLLNIASLPLLEHVEHWLSHDSNLLGDLSTWEKDRPALLYQQLFNHSVEAGFVLLGTPPATPWVRQLNRVGAGDQNLLHELIHPNEVTSVAVSPDNLTVVTACADGIARLWDVSSGRLLQTFTGHSDEITRAAFSPLGNTIATCSRDETARLWDVASGQEIRIFHGHEAALQSIAFSRDGSKIATASEDKTARVWDTASGEMLAYLARHHAMLLDLAFSPTMEHLVTCATDGNVFLWHIETEDVVATLVQVCEGLKSVAFSPDGQYIAISSSDGVQLWNTENQRVVQRFAENYAVRTHAITQVVFSADGQYIAVSSENISSKQSTAQIWHVHTGELWCTYTHRDIISSITLFSDNSTVITGSYDFTVRVWRFLPQPVIISADFLSGNMVSMQFSPDGSQLLIATNDADVYIWNTQSEFVKRAPFPTREEFPEAAGYTASATFTPNGKYVVIGLVGALCVWAVARDLLLPLSVEEEDIFVIYQQNFPFANGIAVAPNGRTLVTGSINENVSVMDLHTRKITARLQAHKGNITSILFTPAGDRIVTASTDGTAIIWDSHTYSLIATLRGHIGSITAMCISPNSALLATGGLDGTIYLWSLASGKRLYTLNRHNQRITCLGFSPHSDLLVSCDLLGQIFFWKVQDVQTPTQPIFQGLYTATHEIGALHWQDDRHIILADTGGFENRPHFYDLTLEGLW